ncbi:DUF2712 domain-containing protein [Butyribacter intestini]|uniref:DUF2712 domain-containing protein n=1 Tax=Butyribacter intestini TaxID=1703332 RepID=UPI003AF1B5BB
MRNIKSIISFGLCCAVITASSIGAQKLGAMASGKGDSVKAQSYSGMIRINLANTTLDKAYRDTTSSLTPFKVRLDNSTEGENEGKYNRNTCTTFWIEDASEKNLSPVVKVLEKEGYYARDTFKEAAKKTVYLTAEDNEKTTHIYKISGKWKEE